jgi:hypothetical protein
MNMTGNAKKPTTASGSSDTGVRTYFVSLLYRYHTSGQPKMLAILNEHGGKITEAHEEMNIMIVQTSFSGAEKIAELKEEILAIYDEHEPKKFTRLPSPALTL